MAANSILAKLAVLISANNASFNRSIKQSQGIFSGFTSQMAAGVLGGFGLVNVMGKISEAVSHGMSVMSGFESTMSEVKAITGATGDEFKRLENDALKLGASTRFTAREVGQLQIAYGRLGFTTKEILQATKATLSLATATGEDLAKSADVAGSTVRGFGLSAGETQRVVDVMASSFNKTALGLDNFSESMKYVAPVAAAAGATVEETTALLGTLADAGIRGSMAGTSLRKIFTDIAKDGRPLQERLAELGKRGITMADAFDEVGRTAQTSLLILAKNTEKTNELATAFKNVEGEAAKMARTMSDNLTGDVIKFTSAYEGLILKIGNTSWWRAQVQGATAFVNALSGTGDIDNELRRTADFIRQMGDDADIKWLDGYIKRMGDVRREAGEPIDVKIVHQLAEAYKLTDQQANILYQSILQANTALSFQEKTIKLFNEFAQRNGYTDLNLAVKDYKDSIYNLILAEQMQLATLQKYTPELEKDIKHTKDQIAAYWRVIRVLAEYGEGLDKVTEKIQEVGRTKPNVDQAAFSNLPMDTYLTTSTSKGFDFLDPSNSMLKGISMVKENLKEYNKTLDETRKKMMEFGDEWVQSWAKVGIAAINAGPVINNGLKDITVGLSVAMGNILSGMGGMEQITAALLSGIGKMAVQLGELAIGTGIAISGIKNALKTLNPAVAIGAGVALIALGTAVSNAARSIGSGASGSESAGSASQVRYGQIGERDVMFDITLNVDGQGVKTAIDRIDRRNGRTGRG
jgi:phage-related minor tail protein